MTAEVAIMNKNAVAMAADSAVTIPTGKGQKIYNTVHKLFKLSRCEPIGIMIYGNAEFMGLPWETLIKLHKESLDDKSFPKTLDYGRDFIKFLEKRRDLFPAKEQKKAFRDNVAGFYSFIKSNIQKSVEAVIAKKGKISPMEIKKIVETEVKNQDADLLKAKRLPFANDRFEKAVLKKYKSDVSMCIKEIFEKLPLTAISKTRLRKIAGSLFSRARFPSGASGIVIAGFGTKEAFPSLISYRFHCVINNKIKYRVENNGIIDFETGGIIMPFAQSEVVIEFMEGIDPAYLNIMRGYLSALFKKYPEILDKILQKSGINLQGKKNLRKKMDSINDEILKKLIEEVENYKKRVHIYPITGMVAMLPKEELAMMAESFVNLTSLKRKISDDQETVGGPIDVAIISKGDGFIWVKRKNYFKHELNQGAQI